MRVRAGPCQAAESFGHRRANFERPRVMISAPVTRFLLRRLLHHPGAVRRRHAGVLADPSGSGRSGAGHARRERVAGRRDRDAPRLGLDRPLYVQYVAFMKGAVTGDLGTSLRTNEPVIGAIAERMPATFELAFAAMVRRAADRDAARHRRGGARRHRRRSRGDDAGAARHLDAELLARAAAGDRVFGQRSAGCRCRAAARWRIWCCRRSRSARRWRRCWPDDARQRDRGTARAVRAGGAGARRVAYPRGA